RDLLNINKGTTGIGEALHEDCARFFVNLILESRNIFRVGPPHLPVEALEAGAELVDRTAIELARRDEIASRLHQRVEDQKLRRMTRSSRKGCGSTFQRRNPLLENSLCWVHDACIDIAEGFETKQRRSMLHIIEYIGCGLIDRRRACARRRVRLCPCMNRQCIETRRALGHDDPPVDLIIPKLRAASLAVLPGWAKR